jgi:hypothetical protein
MRTGIVFAMTLTAAFVCRAALAEDWRSLTKTSGDRPVEIFIDTSSISVISDIRTARTKSVPLLPWRNNARPFNGAAYGIQRRSFDCNAGLVQFGGIELHSADGASLGFIDVEQSWKAAEDPLTKQMFDIVCAFKSPQLKSGQAAQQRTKVHGQDFAG